MLACKGIFAKPSILQPRTARGGVSPALFIVPINSLEDIITHPLIRFKNLPRKYRRAAVL